MQKGTVFVNAVAHLQSTFGNQCTLELTYAERLCLKKDDEETVASYEQDSLDAPIHDLFIGEDGIRRRKIIVRLDNLQYGQSRDIYFSSDTPMWSPQLTGMLDITAELRYSRMRDTQFVVQTRRDALQATDLPKSEIAYHQSRAIICKYLSSFFPPRGDGEHGMPCLTSDFMLAARKRFARVRATIPAKDFRDAYNTSLMQDLDGQIKLAVYDDNYLATWGPHYFLSLWDAHARQTRNTFKDPGVQMYDINSPLFLECQKRLTYAFDTTVQPPKPSLQAQADVKYSSGAVTVSMSSYNSCDYPCFSASSLVTLSTGARVPVSDLRRGAAVQTALGSRIVMAVLKTRVRKITLCRVGDLLITPWHPIWHGGLWVFPAKIAKKAVKYSGAIYSILLERDLNPRAHAVQVGGLWAVTLGHGITEGKDVRAHKFLGNYAMILKAFSAVGVGSDGIAIASGVTREKRTGRLNGFKSGQRPVH
jgi:hypothetical protein